MADYNPFTATNFVELLTARAHRQAACTALYCLADGTGSETAYSYADLDAHAKAWAAVLQNLTQPGDRVLLCLPNGFAYAAGFFACLYAGVVAVPAYPPEAGQLQSVKRVAAIAHHCLPQVLLTLTAFKPSLAGLADSLKATLLVLDTANLALAHAWRQPVLADDSIAFLQYTSGSTSDPKGVRVSHSNLMANERAIKQGFAITESDVFVSWLPLYHDMGLVGGLLQPIFSGIPVVLMSPRYFLERPIRWLQAVSQYRGTVSGGPDFAFRLCNERVRAEQLHGLDLAGWRLAFCGAEPIRLSSLTGFAEKLAAVGLPSSAPYPCYGLAEATLLVTCGRPGQTALANRFNAEHLARGRVLRDAAGIELVACGYPQAGHALLIADPNTGLPADEHQVGEICVNGPSLTSGYWHHAEATAGLFLDYAGQCYLRTGDLGFIDQGQLYLAGRTKDVLLMRGHNVYPHDLELALEQHCSGLRQGRVAVFAWPCDGQDRVAVAVEISRGEQKKRPAAEWFTRINRVIAETCQESAQLILLLQPGALPKTTSGKLQRRACLAAWQAGDLDVFAEYRVTTADSDRSVPQAHEQESAMAQIWADVLKQPVAALDQDFFTLGGQSIASVQIVAAVQERFGVAVEPGLLFEHPTLTAFTQAVLARMGTTDALTDAAIPANDALEGLPLSLGQQGLWAMQQIHPTSTA